MHAHPSHEKLDEHTQKGCAGVVGQLVSMPLVNDEIIQFNNYNRQFQHTFVAYYDFEAITKKLRYKNGSYRRYQKHVPCGCKIKLVDRINGESKSYFYRGEEEMEYFYKALKEVEDHTNEVLRNQLNKHIMWNEGDKEKHDASECCHMW